MPSYPPRTQPFRKQEILDKRIVELKHVIKTSASDEALERAVERVREAHLKLYKGKLAQLRQFKEPENSNVPGAKVKRDLEYWESVSIGDIIKKYADASTW